MPQSRGDCYLGEGRKLGPGMTSTEENGVCNAGKVESSSISEGFITYTRRKRRAPGRWGSARDEPSALAIAGQQKMMKMLHQTVLCNGNSEISGKERIVPLWRSILELAQSDVKNDFMLQNCIGRAPSCGPLGYSDSLNFSGVPKEKDRQKSHYKLRRRRSSTYGVLQHNEVCSNRLQISVKGQQDANTSNSKSQRMLLDLLVSHKFALLCNLLCENFKCGKVTDIGDFSVTMSKMKNGAYIESIECAVEDMQVGLEKFQKIGEEMFLLASDLSSISQASYNMQVRGCSSQASGEPEFEGVRPPLEKMKISVDLCMELQPIANDPNSLTNPKQKGASRCPDIRFTCKQCSSDIHEKNHVFCKVCGAVCHVPCIKPAVEEIETSWYCATCAKKRGSLKNHTSNEHDHMFQNGTVCYQNEDSWYQECRRKNPEAALAVVNGTREPLILENKKTPEPLKDASVTPLCKHCGGPEEEDKLFLVCSHSECLYKYYHIRCMKDSQVASQHQQPNNWYCPSCLCRACFTDRDDELICICDSCDEAYHTYCMKPPREKIPDGVWYCYNCDVEGKGTSGSEVCTSNIIK